MVKLTIRRYKNKVVNRTTMQITIHISYMRLKKKKTKHLITKNSFDEIKLENVSQWVSRITYMYIHTHDDVHIYIYMYVCMHTHYRRK